MQTVLKMTHNKRDRQGDKTVIEDEGVVGTLVKTNLTEYLANMVPEGSNRANLFKGIPTFLDTERYPKSYAFRATDFISFMKEKNIHISPRSLAKTLHKMGLEQVKLSVYLPRGESGMKTPVTRAWVLNPEKCSIYVS